MTWARYLRRIGRGLTTVARFVATYSTTRRKLLSSSGVTLSISARVLRSNKILVRNALPSSSGRALYGGAITPEARIQVAAARTYFKQLPKDLMEPPDQPPQCSLCPRVILEPVVNDQSEPSANMVSGLSGLGDRIMLIDSFRGVDFPDRVHVPAQTDSW